MCGGLAGYGVAVAIEPESDGGAAHHPPKDLDVGAGEWIVLYRVFE